MRKFPISHTVFVVLFHVGFNCIHHISRRYSIFLIYFPYTGFLLLYFFRFFHFAIFHYLLFMSLEYSHLIIESTRRDVLYLFQFFIFAICAYISFEFHGGEEETESLNNMCFMSIEINGAPCGRIFGIHI